MLRLIYVIMSALVLLTVLVSMAAAQPPIPPNVRVTTIPQLNNEEQLVICPTDTAIIMANWRDFRLNYRQIGLGRSTDGGQTWVDSLIHPLKQYFSFNAWQSDPTITVDRNGNFFMTALDFIPNSAVASVIAFYRSTDKGLTWTGPVPNVSTLSARFEDKQFTDVDRSGGIYDGRFYVSWSRFDSPSRIMMVHTNNDLTGVSDTLIVGPVQYSTGCGGAGIDAGQFSIPCVDKNGKVHVFWVGFALDSGGSCTGELTIKYAHSTDGGASFVPPQPLFQVSGYTETSSGIQTYSQPVVMTDLTAGPYSGNLYMCMTNDATGIGSTDIDFTRSTDGGVTWSPFTRINDDINTASVDNFHPWLTCNEEGILTSVFYDTRYDPGNNLFDLIAAYSFDGGLTWTTNHRVSSVSSNPGFLPAVSEPVANLKPARYGVPSTMAAAEPMAGRLGEYIGLAVVYDKVNTVWTDTRHGNSEVYSATWHLPLSVARLIAPVNNAPATAQPLLTWATSWKENDDRYLVEVASDAGFSTIVSSQMVDSNKIHVASVLTGGQTYYWRVRSSKISSGETAAYSSTGQFVVDATPPGVPLPTMPAFGAVINTPTTLFNWGITGGITEPGEYDLYISSEPTFTNPGLLQVYTYSNASFPPVGPLGPFLPGVLMHWKVVARDLAGNESVSAVSQFTFNPSCCVNLVGNADGDAGDAVDISDLQIYVDYLFFGGAAATCFDEFDTNNDVSVDIADLQTIVDYLFLGGSLPACP